MNQWLTSQLLARPESDLGGQPLDSEAVTCMSQVDGQYVISARLTSCT